jgi:microcystin-dependent protein
MADTFTPNFNLTLPEIGGSLDTWGDKLNANLAEIDKLLLPVGVIVMWSGSVANIPSGWALCDGTNGTPDLRGRFVVGAGGSYAVGANGGAETVTLTTAQIPAHGHSGSASSAGGHSHSGSTGSAGSHSHSMGGAGGHNHTTGSSGSHSHSGSANSAGAHTHSWFYRTGSNGSMSPGVTSFASSQNSGTTSSAGAHTHSLSINSSGSHSHSVSSVSNHSHTINSNGAHTHSVSISTVNDHTHNVTVSNTGGGGSHENRPPYYALAYIMNVG